jgi:AraC family transcriptional regulator
MKLVDEWDRSTLSTFRLPTGVHAMPPRLPAGHYYGDVQASRQVDGIFLSETTYSPETRIPRHSHVNAHLTLVRQGAFTETYGTRTRLCEALTLSFHPPEEIHSARIHDTGALSFNIELDAEWLCRREIDVFQEGFDFQGGDLARIMLRLNHEFHLSDEPSSLAIEGMTLELLAVVARKRQSGPSCRKMPPWLERAWQIVQERFREPLTLSDVASVVAVHPVHLATTFRRYYRCSLGDAVRRKRIELASQQLAVSDAPMSEIAVACGFADQSHFCNTFKRQVGMTPSNFRRTCQSR